MTTIYFVRHMETKANVARVFQGQSNTDPSEMGLRQLEWLKNRFKDVNLDKIYASPLERTKLTANAVKGDKDTDIIYDNRLMEIKLGDLENIEIANMEDTYPNEYFSLTQKLYTLSAPNGENVEQVYKRMVEALDEIIQNNPNKTVAVVSHGLALQTYCCKLHGQDYTYIDNIVLGQNTSVTKATFDENKTPTIVYMGDVEHIPAEHRKVRKRYVEKSK